MRKNKSFSLAVAFMIAACAYMLSLAYFITRRVCRFIVKRYSFILSCLLTLCAVGMLYNSIATESPMKGAWVTMCIGMVTLAVGANCYIWKEE